jgi:hypothetical protein
MKYDYIDFCTSLLDPSAVLTLAVLQKQVADFKRGCKSTFNGNQNFHQECLTLSTYNYVGLLCL